MHPFVIKVLYSCKTKEQADIWEQWARNRISNKHTWATIFEMRDIGNLAKEFNLYLVSRQ